MKLPKSTNPSGVRLDKTRPDPSVFGSTLRINLSPVIGDAYMLTVACVDYHTVLPRSFGSICIEILSDPFSRLAEYGDNRLSRFCKICTQFCARHNEILQRALLPRNFSKLLRLGGILRSLGFEFGTRWRETVIAFINMYVQIPRMI